MEAVGLREFNQHGYIVRVSENSLIQMCLNGIEAYVVKHKQGKGKKSKNMIETYGLLWGHQINQPDKKTLYCVEMVSIDTSAVRDTNSVIPRKLALRLKKDLLTSFWPQYEFLGDFHTHPYEHYKEVLDEKDMNLAE